jgi:hypothetical protein
VREWFNRPVLKTGVPARVPWVRIPPLPPLTIEIIIYFYFLVTHPSHNPSIAQWIDDEVPQMKKHKLGQWLTIADAARHLSILFGEDVSEADVLRFALDGHLTLSVYFVNGAVGRCGSIVSMSIDDISRTIAEKLLKRTVGEEKPRFWNELTFDPSTGKFKFRQESLLLGDDGRSISFVGRMPTSLDGVWDLTMLGHEKLEIEQRYQVLTGGPEVDMRFRNDPLDHPIVCREDGTYCQIYHDWLHPADRLPADSVIVVRTSALHDLEAQLSEKDQKIGRPVGRRERSTLLVIIGALAALAKFDVRKPSAAAAAIETQTTLMEARVSRRTIENHLNLVSEALEDRRG